MVVIRSNENTEIVGMDVQYQMPLTIPSEKIWKAMVDKNISSGKIFTRK